MFSRRLFEHGEKVSAELRRLPSFRSAINDALREEMERDETMIVIGQDVAKAPAFGVTLGLVDKFGEDRVRDTPISESAMVGAAVGAGLAGIRIIVEMQFGDFLSVAVDQITHQAGMLKYLSGGQFKIPMVVRLPCGAGQGTGSQHAQCLYSWFMHAPGIKVVLPSTSKDAKGLMKTAIRDDNPVLYYEHKMLYRSRWGVPPEYYEPEYLIPFGQAEVKREGRDVTVVATLMMVHYAIAAANELEKEGISVEVIDPRTLVPIDKQTILNSVRKTGRLVVVDEAYMSCGIQGEIIAIVTEELFSYLKAAPKRLGNPDVPVPFPPALEDEVIPSKDKIMGAIEEVMKS